MGKVTGFMEFERLEEGYEPVGERVKNYKEFVIGLSADQSKQQAARCMDCGTPFCNNGCPVNNIIPDFNDLVYQGDWANAITILHSTNNFPEFTGRICPAPCEAACTLNVNDDAVGIKSIEHAIIDRAWSEGWVQPQLPKSQNRQDRGHRRLRPGRSWRLHSNSPAPATASLCSKRTTVLAACCATASPTSRWRSRTSTAAWHRWKPRVWFSVPACWSPPCRKAPRSPTGPKTTSARTSSNRSSTPSCSAAAPKPAAICRLPAVISAGIHFAMEFLPQQNKVNAGDKLKGQIRADGKHVVVIGGGDTGSDCVGTSNRHGAKSVTQFELMPQPPEVEDRPLTWPYWPLKLRTSSSHEEGCEREFAISTKEFVGEKGKLTGVKTVRVEWQGGKMVEVPGSEQIIKADLVFLAMGFVAPVATVLDAFGVSQGRPRQRQGQHRLQRRLQDQCGQGLRRWRYASGPVPGRVGDPGRPSSGARSG